MASIASVFFLGSDVGIHSSNMGGGIHKHLVFSIDAKRVKKYIYIVLYRSSGSVDNEA